MQRSLLFEAASGVVPIVCLVSTLAVKVGLRRWPISHRDGLISLLDEDAALDELDLHLEEVGLIA